MSVRPPELSRPAKRVASSSPWLISFARCAWAISSAAWNGGITSAIEGIATAA